MALRHLPHRPVLLSLIATAAALLTPSAASAAWTFSPTPDPQGSTVTTLNAVDCSSAKSCMAVGYTNVSSGPPMNTVTYLTVAEQWDGTTWQIVPTPGPFNGNFTSLNGVSCPRPNVCLAVGNSGSGSSSAPLIERWNGTSWSHQPSPAVPGGSLGAVSCSGLLACTAIGGSDASGTLAERWDGTGWHVQSVPDAPGSQSSVLSDVSCPLKRTCTAVGQTNGQTIPLAPLAERWFGRVNSWGLQAAPKPDGADLAQLSGVSCPDGPVCFAVGGSFGPRGPNFERDVTTLAERRVGSRWSVMPTPNPTPAQGSRPNANLVDISCLGPRTCHAVGDAFDSTGPIVIAERFDGASWRLESIPYPYSDWPELAGVSCPNRLFCMAVGSAGGFVVPGGLLAHTLAAKWTP